MTTAPREGIGATAHIPVVALVSAEWAGPSRPAPTVLRELSRRWGDAVKPLLIEDPADEVLEQLRVTVLPTWLRFIAAVAVPGETGLTIDELRGKDVRGSESILPGPWRLVHQRTGALPKHEVDREFGPVA